MYCPRFPFPLLVIPFLHLRPWQPQILSVPISFPFPGCHVNGAIAWIAFPVWLLLLSMMPLRPIHVIVFQQFPPFSCWAVFQCVSEPIVSCCLVSEKAWQGVRTVTSIKQQWNFSCPWCGSHMGNNTKSSYVSQALPGRDQWWPQGSQNYHPHPAGALPGDQQRLVGWPWLLYTLLSCRVAPKKAS